jgi:ElaB/YqjD/DUF883 family membrane-anchored ribosome-binding protein
MEPKDLKEDIDDLKQSTEKLGRHLAEAGSERVRSSKIGTIPREIVTSMNRNLKLLREKVGEIADGSVEQSKRVDQRIHNKPYWFLAAAFGTGLILGRYLVRNSNRTLD